MMKNLIIFILISFSSCFLFARSDFYIGVDYELHPKSRTKTNVDLAYKINDNFKVTALVGVGDYIFVYGEDLLPKWYLYSFGPGIEWTIINNSKKFPLDFGITSSFEYGITSQDAIPYKYYHLFKGNLFLSKEFDINRSISIRPQINLNIISYIATYNWDINYHEVNTVPGLGMSCEITYGKIFFKPEYLKYFTEFGLDVYSSKQVLKLSIGYNLGKA